MRRGASCDGSFVAPNSVWIPTDDDPTNPPWLDGDFDFEDSPGTMADPGYVVVRNAVPEDLVLEASTAIHDRLTPLHTKDTHWEYGLSLDRRRAIVTAFIEVRSTSLWSILPDANREIGES
jgi:hypothetical protein